MSNRRERILDAAIAVLGARGLRQLTHRTVDAEAGLPTGSTSNVFRTREALVSGVLGRLLTLETRAWQAIAGLPRPTTPEELAALLGRTVRDMTKGPGRVLTLARHAIFLEAAFDPALQERIAEARTELAAWAVPWIAALGSPEPGAHLSALLSTLDGLMSNRLAAPDPHFDPEKAVLVVVRGMLAT